MYQKKDFSFKDHWAFFAFSNQQFEEQKVDGVKYVSAWHGLFCPADKAKQILEAFKEHNEKEKQKQIEVDWIDNIIRYELGNYECYYTWDLSDVEWMVEEYGVTMDYIKNIYREELKNIDF